MKWRQELLKSGQKFVYRRFHQATARFPDETQFAMGVTIILEEKHPKLLLSFCLAKILVIGPWWTLNFDFVLFALR